MVGLGTRPAIERAGTETPHLQRGAPDFYPNDRSRRALPSRSRRIGASAPLGDHVSGSAFGAEPETGTTTAVDPALPEPPQWELLPGAVLAVRRLGGHLACAHRQRDDEYH